MTDSKILSKKIQLLDNLEFSTDTLKYAVSVLPLFENVVKSIATLKFEPSEESKKKYSESLKELGSFVLINYSKTLSLYRFTYELKHFFTHLEQLSIQREIKRNNPLSIQQQISEICQRHYKPAQSQATPPAP